MGSALVGLFCPALIDPLAIWEDIDQGWSHLQSCHFDALCLAAHFIHSNHIAMCLKEMTEQK